MNEKVFVGIISKFNWQDRCNSLKLFFFLINGCELNATDFITFKSSQFDLIHDYRALPPWPPPVWLYWLKFLLSPPPALCSILLPRLLNPATKKSIIIHRCLTVELTRFAANWSTLSTIPWQFIRILQVQIQTLEPIMFHLLHRL